MTLYDIHSCPECGAMNSSRLGEHFKEIDPYKWQCYRCLVILPKGEFEFVQGPAAEGHGEDE